MFGLKRKTLIVLILLTIASILPACQSALRVSKNFKQDVMTISDHQRAVSALNAKDLSSAQGYVTGMEYQHRYKEIQDGESWSSLQYRAAKIVVSASVNGKPVQDDALYFSYMTLFEVGEGLPESPETMLDYMHKAMAMRIANPHILDNIKSNLVSKNPSQFTLERYAIWQYLSDGGEIDWNKTAQTGEGNTIAGISYRTWNIRLRKTLWNRGDIFLAGLNKSQFIHETIDYSQFPQVACVAQRKGWNLKLPQGYQFQNFRGGGAFDMTSCERIE